MSAGLYITGTGTDVGKTVITGALYAQACAAGVCAVPFKPVQSGAQRVDNVWRSPDVAVYRSFRPLDLPDSDLVTFFYNAEQGPSVAARFEGNPVAIDNIIDNYYILCEQHDLVLVEGAGGLLSPLSDTCSQIDIMTRLKVPALVVAGHELGTINSTVLTCNELRRANVGIAGIIISGHRGNDRYFEQVVNEIRNYTQVARVFRADHHALEHQHERDRFVEQLPCTLTLEHGETRLCEKQR